MADTGSYFPSLNCFYAPYKYLADKLILSTNGRRFKKRRDRYKEIRGPGLEGKNVIFIYAIGLHSKTFRTQQSDIWHFKINLVF